MTWALSKSDFANDFKSLQKFTMLDCACKKPTSQVVIDNILEK
jgi:hypothetical protein